MPKGYWISFYRSVSDTGALAEYSKLAGPALQAGGGRFVVRGMPSKTFEMGMDQRTVIIEFDSVEQAITTYQSPAYQAAFQHIKGKVEREVRIVEGVA